MEAISCKKKAGCIVTAIALIVAFIVFGSFALSTIADSLYLGLIQELGFKDKNEYNEFVDKINADFDSSTILTNMPTEQDVASSKTIMQNSIALTNSSPLFLGTGLIDVKKVVSKTDIQLTGSMQFSDKQFCSALNLLIQSILASDEEDIEISDDFVLKQFSFSDLEKTRFTFIFEIDATNIKSALGQLSGLVPKKMLIIMDMDLSMQGTKWQATETNIVFNQLDDATNKKFLSILETIFDKTSQTITNEIGEITIDFLETIFSLLDCNMTINNDIIYLNKTI